MEYVLWGLPKGSSDRLDEVVLTAGHHDRDRVERVRGLASADGFHSFRLIEMNLAAAPDFAGAVAL